MEETTKHGKKKQSNPTAFPISSYAVERGFMNTNEDIYGMTLRDYFANSAMQGGCVSNGPEFPTPKAIAKWANAVADAMLKKREIENL